jgi:DNA-binding MarR family transcriptional regulator
VIDTIGALLWQVTLAWQRAMRAALEPHDLTHIQFVLLYAAWSMDGHPTQDEIAEHTGTEQAMAAQVLRRLAARQLVTRELDPDDPKARRIVLTETGRHVLADAVSDVEITEAEFFAALGPSADDFRRNLDALRAG